MSRQAVRVAASILFVISALAQAAVAEHQPGTVTCVKGGEKGERTYTVENDFIKLVIDAGMGGRIRSLVHKRTGQEITVPESESPRWGLLSTQLWQQSFPHGDWNRYPCNSQAMPLGAKQVRIVTQGPGVRWEGVSIRRTLTVDAGRSAVDVEYRITSSAQANPRAAGDLWIHNALPAGSRVYMPTLAGVLERPRGAEAENTVFSLSQGWIAGIAPNGTGLAVRMDFSHMRNLRTLHSGVTTLEWVLRKASLKPGARHETKAVIAPIADLNRVDGVFSLAAVSLEPVDDGKRVRVAFLPFEGFEAKVTVSLRRLPDGQSEQILADSGVFGTDDRDVAHAPLNITKDGSYVLECRVEPKGGEPYQCERLITVGKPSGTYAMRPEGKRIGEHPDFSTWQRYHPIDFNFNSLAVETPHRMWARPYAGGRPRVLALVPQHEARQAVELAQRFDMKLTVPFLTKSTYYALGDRYRSLNIRDVHAALDEAVIGKPFDVIITANNGGWPLLTQACKDYIIKLVKEDGAGLVMIQRGKLPEEFGDAFPLKHHWYDSSSGEWTLLDAKNGVLDGLPFDAMPFMSSQCGTRANRPDKRGLPSGPNEEALVKSGRELTMAVGQWGKGRLAQLVINGPLLPNSATVRGRQLREPPPFDYWEYQMMVFGRFIYWAARMESPVTVKRVECRPEMVRVALKSTVGGPARALFLVRDRFGAVLHSEEVPIDLKATINYVKLKPPAEVVAGAWVVDFVLTNEKGTLAWGGGTYGKEGPRIKSVSLDKTVYGVDEQPKVSIALNPAPAAGSKVRVEMWDGTGRAVSRQTADAAAATDVTLAFGREIGPVVQVRAWLLGPDGVVLDQGMDVARVRQDAEARRAQFHLMFWGGTDATMPSYLIQQWLERYRTLGVTADLLGAGPLEHTQRELDTMNMPFISASVGMAARVVTKEGVAAKPDAETFTSPKAREGMQKSAADRARAVADQNRLMNTMGDENRVNTKDGDFTKDGLAELRKWLQREYKTIGALNAEWKTTFAAWDDVMPMTEAEVKEHGKATGSYAPWADHQQFDKWAYAQLAHAAMTGFKSVDANIRCGPSGTQTGSVYGGRDWWLLAREYTALAGYSGPQYNQQYSFNPSVLRYPWMGYGKPNPILRTSTWRHLGNINAGLACFHWKTHIDPDMTVPECGRDLRAMWLEMGAGVGRLLKEARPATAQVYVLQSSQSIHGDYVIGQAAVGQTARKAMETIMEDLGCEYLHISYAQLAQGELEKTRAKVLLLPHTVALSDAECDAIRRWVRQGGTVIADMGAGIMTQHCRLRQRPQLDDLFGIDRSKSNVEKGEWALKGGDVNVACAWIEKGLTGQTRGTLSANGTPVLFVSSYGKGKAVYGAMDLFGAYLQARAGAAKPEGYAVFEPFQRTLADVIEKAGVVFGARPVFVEGKPTRVPFLVLQNKTTGVNRYVIATREQSVAYAALSDIPARLKFSAPAHIYDVLLGQELGYGDEVDLWLSDNTVRLFALLPYRVTRVALSGEDTAKRGADAQLKAVVEATAEPELHVYRVEVTDPSGAFNRAYSGNIVAAGGRANITLRFALNDMPGAWTVLVRDVATGVSTRKTITLAEE